jgi:hypothetical protein
MFQSIENHFDRNSLFWKLKEGSQILKHKSQNNLLQQTA